MPGSQAGQGQGTGGRATPKRGGGEGTVATRWIILAGALGITAAATLFVALGSRERDAARFNNAVQTTSDRIVGRLDVYISTLRGGASLFAALDTVDRQTFARYTERLELQRRYPGIQGFGWTVRLEAGLPGDRDERHAILFLEPLDERNQAALNFDMYSEPTRREAMRRARDQGEPAITGRVTLVQEIIGPRQPGFLIYAPVYRDGIIPGSVEERRAALDGFVYAPFRANDLFAGIFGTELAPRTHFSVYDGVRTDATALLFDTGHDPAHSPRHVRVEAINVAGRPWTVVYRSSRQFEAASTWWVVPLIALGGLVASLWLFYLATGQSRARMEAESGNRTKSAFLATMSHELRTPLNAIGGYVDLIRLGVAGPVTSQQQSYLERVQRAQQHLLGLINDVLNYAKLDAGRVTYDPRIIPVGDAVGDAAAMVTGQADQQGIRFVVDDGPAVELCCDREKLRQILLNLYSNAIKFTPVGGEVRTGWEVAGAHVAITVLDTGIGIPGEELENIFEPFLQVDAHLTRQQQGTGLGLSISRELARGMGGDLVAASGQGEGSRFTLTVPLHTPS
jgi:signal transduction histidine kinase